MGTNGNHILLIDGKDEKGLIYHITGTLFNQGLNIIHNSEFVEKDTNHFFMRSEFTGNVKQDNLITELRKVLPKGFNIVYRKQCKKNIVVMASTEHHCLADLLVRNKYDKLNATILCVISNHEELRSLVEQFGIPFHYVPHGSMSREAHEQEIFPILEKCQPDFLVLAKYMRILTPLFVQQYQNRIVNIHHSFLPAFIGVNPYEQAYKRGVKIIGATAHFVNEKLDEGAILVQEVIQISHKFSVEDMRQAGQDAEVLALAKALRYVFEDRVFISGNKTIIFT